MLLINSLTELREALTAVRLPLTLPGSAEQAVQANQITSQLDDYVLPRLVNLEAPLLTVVGGSTGAGKSTLVNSLIGRVVTKPGVIRPTTRSPVLVYNPADERWFDNERILPGLVRSRVSSADNSSLQLVAEPTLPPGLAILDAPDVDSVVTANRRLATQLLEAADLWLFVTSAARYADAVPWEFLKAAANRSAAIGVVLDRIPPAAMNVLPADLGRMMTERGLAEAPLFAVPETVVDEQGLLPDAAVAPIRSWLAALAADKDTRQRVVMQTLDGAIGALAVKAPEVANAIDEQVEVAKALHDDAAASYAEAVRAASIQSADGTLLRGEVLGRWHDFVGTSEFAKALDEKVSWLRDRIASIFKSGAKQGDDVAVAASSGLEALLREQGEAAAERAVRAWQGNPAGRQLFEKHPELARASDDYPYAVARAIRAWQSDVMELVSQEGSDKRKTARIAALGVNGVGAALILVIFASTGGLTGAEVGVAGGTSVLAQRLLESIFGGEAVRKLAERAKADLDTRIEGLMATEMARFTAVLDGLDVDTDNAERIRGAAQAVTFARKQLHDEGVIRGALEPAETPAIESGETPAIEQGQQPSTVQLNRTDDAHDAEVVDAEVVERVWGTY